MELKDFMYNANELLPYLPYLRRFTRALTGSQSSGDNLVKQVLIQHNQTTSSNQPDPKSHLYHLLFKLWQNPARHALKNTSTDDHKLLKVSSHNRLIFLLNTLESFSDEQLEGICGLSTDQINQHLEQVNAEIANELKTSVLIIEDEPMVAADIASIVESLGHTVSGIAATHTDAVVQAEQEQPGLILTDVHLADDSSGIEAVDEILQSFSVPVIFITAFPELLLTGERLEPTYLISKPFTAGNVKAAISQALYFFKD